MKSEPFSCPVCLASYNQNTKLPRVLPTCGHTICTECLLHILDFSAKCPLDKESLPKQKEILNPFPINFTVKQFLEEREVKGVCQEHGEDLINFCLTDKCKICNECYLEGIHQGHKIQTIKKSKLEADAKIKELDSIRETIERSYQDLRDELHEKQKQTLEFIRGTFERFRSLLLQKEGALLGEIIENFMEKKAHLDNILGPHSTLYLSVEKKMSNLALEMKKGDFMNIREANFEQINSDVAGILSFWRERIVLNHTERKMIQDKLEKEFLEIHNLIEKVNLSYSEESWKEADPSILITPQYSLSDFAELEVKSNLTFEVDRTGLKILVGGEMKHLIISKNMWEKIDEVEIVFKRNEIIKEDWTVLRYLWETIVKVRSLKVSFPSKKITDESLLEIFPIISSRIEELEEIFLDFRGSPLSDKSVTFVFEKYICKITSLKALHLDFSSTKISSKSIKALVKSTRKFMENLEKYEIYLSQNELFDEDAIQLLCPMPKVQTFQLSLGSTKITDRTLRALAEIIPTMEALDILELHFWSVNIQAESILVLFQSPKDVRKFYLDFDQVEVSDQVILEFEKNFLPQMKNLKEVYLRPGSGVTGDGLDLLDEIHDIYPYEHDDYDWFE